MVREVEEVATPVGLGLGFGFLKSLPGPGLEMKGPGGGGRSSGGGGLRGSERDGNGSVERTEEDN